MKLEEKGNKRVEKEMEGEGEEEHREWDELNERARNLMWVMEKNEKEEMEKKVEKAMEKVEESERQREEETSGRWRWICEVRGRIEECTGLLMDHNRECVFGECLL